MKNTRVRLNLSSWAAISPSLAVTSAQCWALPLLKSHLHHLAFFLESISVYPACEPVLVHWGHSQHMPWLRSTLGRSLVNIQKRKCRRTAGVWSPARLIVFLSCWRTAGSQDALVSLLNRQFLAFSCLCYISCHTVWVASEGHSYVCSLCIWEIGISSSWHLQRKCRHPQSGRGRRRCFPSGHSWGRSHPLLPGCFWYLQSTPAFKRTIFCYHFRYLDLAS